MLGAVEVKQQVARIPAIVWAWAVRARELILVSGSAVNITCADWLACWVTAARSTMALSWQRWWRPGRHARLAIKDLQAQQALTSGNQLAIDSW